MPFPCWASLEKIPVGRLYPTAHYQHPFPSAQSEAPPPPTPIPRGWVEVKRANRQLGVSIPTPPPGPQSHQLCGLAGP